MNSFIKISELNYDQKLAYCQYPGMIITFKERIGASLQLALTSVKYSKDGKINLKSHFGRETGFLSEEQLMNSINWEWMQEYTYTGEGIRIIDGLTIHERYLLKKRFKRLKQNKRLNIKK